MINVIHITHTDIRNDWRIRKEIISLSKNSLYNLLGIGIDHGYNVNFPSDQISSRNVGKINRKNIFLYFFTSLIACIKMLKELLKMKNINILHCHDTPALLIGYLIKLQKKDIRIIYDSHELQSNKAGQSFFFKVCTILIEKLILKNIDGLITVSPSILNWYKDNYDISNCFNALVFNAPNYIENIEVEDVRSKLNLPINSKLYSYVGLLIKERGVEDILEAFKTLPKEHVIIFFGKGELEKLIEFESSRHGNIFYFGNVPNTHLHSYLSQLQYGLCTIENASLSDFYALPNKFFECVNANLTVIVPDFPDLACAVNKNNLGYVIKDNNLEETLQKVILTKEEPPKKNLHEFTWFEQEKKLKKLYEDILSK